MNWRCWVQLYHHRIGFSLANRGAFIASDDKGENEIDRRKGSSYQKPTLRSEAFTRAVHEAKLRLVGSGGLRSLFEKAARKAASLPRHRFKENWPYLQTMLRLVALTSAVNTSRFRMMI